MAPRGSTARLVLFDPEPSGGDGEPRRSGAVVLECRISVSKAFTRRLFVDRLESHRTRAVSQFARFTRYYDTD